MNTSVKRIVYYSLVCVKWLFLWGLVVFAIFPLLQVISNSLRPDMEIKKMPLGLPKVISFENYPITWLHGGYGRAYINSLVVATWTIVITISLIGIAAYALAKVDMAAKNFFNSYFLMAMAIPSFAYLVPTYYLFNQWGLNNTLAGLIITYVARNIPFNLLLLRTFLLGIPRELEEAAKVDGCNELSTFFRITLPLSKSMFLTVALLLFLNTWNEFPFANTFLTKDETRTVATKFVKFTTEFNVDFARVFTSSVISIAPVAIVYLVMQNRFIDGLTSGGLKG